MKRTLALALAVALTLGTTPSFVGAQAQAIGVIAGTASGPSGALAGATVQLLNSAGQIVGSVVANAEGFFSFGALQAGQFTVQVLSTSGVVIGTSTATLAAGAMSATVTISATAAAIGGAVGGGILSGAAAGGGLGTGAVLGGLAAAAGVAGAVVAVTKKDASPSR